jgi:hypothetical protein
LSIRNLPSSQIQKMGAKGNVDTRQLPPTSDLERSKAAMCSKGATKAA